MLLNPLNTRTDFGPADAEEAARLWPIFLVTGFGSIAFGVIILSIDWSVDSLGTFVGILFILQGAGLAITPSLDGNGRWSNVGAGLIAGAAGVALIAWPDKGLRVVGIFGGVFVLSLGTLHIVGAIANRHVPNWWLTLVIGVIEVPIGLWAVRRPGLRSLSLSRSWAPGRRQSASGRSLWPSSSGSSRNVIAPPRRRSAPPVRRRHREPGGAGRLGRRRRFFRGLQAAFRA